jgi:WD40 repeat protein
VVDLHYSNDKPNGVCEASLTAASAEYLAPDWMLAGCTDDSGNAYLVTGHNALLGLRVVNGRSPIYRSAILLRQLVTGVKSILYSADAVSLSTSHVLIAAGTVFGEVIVWSCFLGGSENPSSAQGSIHHFFTGHEGSIFGVKISPKIPFLHGDQPGRLLASCSDDRTVRIWDISDCEHRSRDDPSAYSTDGFELRSTGFGIEGADAPELGSESCVAKAFGHVSRIWGVRFLPLLDGEQRQLSLLSHGEDATCVLWNLSWRMPSEDDFQLRQASSFHEHTGRNIFSLDMYRARQETIVHTGGADGAIKTLKIGGSEKTAKGSVESSASNSNVPKRDGRGPLRAYSFVSPDGFLATTAQGEIQIGQLTSQTQDSKASMSRETLCAADDLRSFSVVTGLPYKGLALLGNAQGLIRLYNHSTRSLSTIAQMDQRIQGLFASDPETGAYPSSNSSHDLSFVAYCAAVDRANLFMVTPRNTADMDVVNITLDLPRRFDINCASLLCGNSCLVLGSRHGALAIYHVSNTGQALQPLIFIRRVHGELGMAGVNKITPFWSHSPSCGTFTEYFMTCGRDGYFCVHEMEMTSDAEKPVAFRTVHRSPTNLGQNVAGAYFDRGSQDLMLYGFQHKQFILWNESAQTEIASIDCGGPRRTWDFYPGDESTGGAVFLWIQASELNAYRLPTDRNRPLRAGAHGREIKTMEVFNAADKKNTVFATGAEDTTVRIFGPSPPQAESAWGAFKCLRVIKHTTSLQQVSFSKDGRFLFASSGLEEFYVWRIRSIPVFGFAAHLVALGPKDEPTSDLRVTGFDVLDVEEEGSQQSFLFCLTLSNSTIKVMSPPLVLLCWS